MSSLLHVLRAVYIYFASLTVSKMYHDNFLNVFNVQTKGNLKIQVLISFVVSLNKINYSPLLKNDSSRSIAWETEILIAFSLIFLLSLNHRLPKVLYTKSCSTLAQPVAEQKGKGI